MKERRKEEDAQIAPPPAASDKPATSGPTEPKKPAGLEYRFKIAPADPKNSFDFEDVADK